MNETVTADIPCNLCGNADVSIVSRRSRDGKALRSVACRQCGLVWSDPRPHDARRFYENEYRLAYKRTFEPQPRHVLRAGKVALSRLAQIRPLLAGRLRILDVGAGGGEFAYLLTKLGHEVDAIEPNHGYAGYAASQYGLPVTRGMIGDVALPEASYDLITMWHVLEHTEDPAGVLRQLARALRPGGTLVVEVPNVEATCQAPGSTFHEAHLYDFNLATLLAMGTAAGLSGRTGQLSADGGNLMVLFAAPVVADSLPPPVRALPGNHDRVAGVLRNHSHLPYWLSPLPYRRLAGRIRRMHAERRETGRAATGRERLDTLYAQALAGDSASEPQARRSRPLWQWVLGAYAAALLLEWALLDRLLPGRGWSENEALALYTALQCAAVGGVLWITSRPQSMRQFAKLAAWAAPLFALPAYC